jgi:hypothetical protein
MVSPGIAEPLSISGAHSTAPTLEFGLHLGGVVEPTFAKENKNIAKPIVLVIRVPFVTGARALNLLT